MERVSDVGSERLNPGHFFVVIGRSDGASIADCDFRSHPSTVAAQLVRQRTQSRGHIVSVRRFHVAPLREVIQGQDRYAAFWFHDDSDTRILKPVVDKHSCGTRRCLPLTTAIPTAAEDVRHRANLDGLPSKHERPVAQSPHIETDAQSLRQRRCRKDDRTRYRPLSGSACDSSVRPAVRPSTNMSRIASRQVGRRLHTEPGNDASGGGRAIRPMKEALHDTDSPLDRVAGAMHAPVVRTV
jgi:hypothetical protein